MSLLNKASLIQIPSGYKDGTLYSAKPTNGDGDFTFSRGSNLAATRVNSDGLIEKGRENLLLQSNQFDTTWTTTGSALTSGQSDKDGGTDAWLLQSNNTGQSFVKQVIALTGVKTYSVFAKAGTADFLILYAVGGGDARTFFDLANGTTETESFNITNKIEDVGNGWYRCSLIFDKTISDVRLFIADSDGVYNSGNGSNIYIQDSQLELGLVATDYIETGASTAQAGILEDMPRLDYSGGAICPSLLLEPQRTNALTHSEYFGGYSFTNGSITTNNTTSPEGLSNGSTFVESTATGTHQMRITTGVTSGSDVTFSFYAKANGRDYVNFWEDVTTGDKAYFNLSTGVATNSGFTSVGIEDAGSGWYRCYGTKSSFSGSLFGLRIHASQGANFNSYTGDGVSGFHIYGLQVEEGSYSTSYIPTYGASVTRGADSCNDAGNANVFNNDTAVWFIDIERMGIDSTDIGDSLTLRDSSYIRQITLWFDAPTEQIRFRDGKNSFTTIGSSGGVIGTPAGERKKIALKIDGTTLKVFADGVQKGSDYTRPTAFDITQMAMTGIGYEIKNIIFYTTALSDDECIQLTTL